MRVALVGYIPLVILMFAMMPARKAFLTAMIGGWLFLPVGYIKLHGLPELSKLTSASYGCILGAFLFDWQRIASFRLKWYDLPMVVWCLVPFVTSVLNTTPYLIYPGLDAYEGGSAVMDRLVVFGVPYALGRIYFRDWESFKELGIGILMGGLIYVPLCLIEIRVSPQLHRMIYGVAIGDFSQSKRMGGYRPMVFLSHGLSVGMWMTSASLVGVWMWQCKTIKSVWGIPMAVCMPILLVTTLLCKSTAALGFLAAGLGILYSIKYLKTPLFLLVVMAAAPTYMYVRASGQWDGKSAVELATSIFGEARAQSLNTRISAENRLAEHAMEQPYFGWGRFNRNRVYGTDGKDIAPTDGMWIIALGVSGVVGLVSLTLFIMLVPILVWVRCPLKFWSHPGVAPAAAMAVLLSTYMLDNILNALPDPIFIVAIGGLMGIAPSIRRQLGSMRQLSAPGFPVVSSQPYAAPGTIIRPTALPA